MFIAHLPAGYLLTRAILRRAHRPSGKLLALGLVASIAPDFDLLYFYFFDQRQVHHHAYALHWPLAWAAVCGSVMCVALLLKKRAWLLPAIIVLANGLLHMVLDTLVGGIAWLAPFNKALWHVTSVPAQYSWWPANFILHWTFLLELLIVLVAYLQWKRK